MVILNFPTGYLWSISDVDIHSVLKSRSGDNRTLVTLFSYLLRALGLCNVRLVAALDPTPPQAKYVEEVQEVYLLSLRFIEYAYTYAYAYVSYVTARRTASERKERPSRRGGKIPVSSAAQKNKLHIVVRNSDTIP